MAHEQAIILDLSMASSSSSSSKTSMISTAPSGAGLFRSSVEVSQAKQLPPLQGRQLSTAPARPLARKDMSVETIDISNDDEEIDSDLLLRESESASMGLTVKQEEAWKAKERASLVTSSDSSASSSSSGVGYYINFRNGRPQMRRIHRFMCGPYRDP